MTDFFISYTSADEQWAEWIAYVLEEARFSTKLQKWDFRPGSNFVLEMQRAAQEAKRTVMLLSQDYLQSQFASPEWAAAFANDPQGLQKAVVPVVVRDCNPSGMLKPIVHINLVGLSEEDARKALLEGIRTERAKPTAKPQFPGQAVAKPLKTFPGATALQAPLPYLPKVRQKASDADKRRFIKQSFEVIKSYVEHTLAALGQQTQGLEFDFSPITTAEFTAEIFLHGKSVTACKIWQGGIHSDNGIYYSEGRQRLGNNGYNEMLMASDENGDLALQATMAGFSPLIHNLNTRNLSPDQAAEYLWRKFVTPLERS